MTLPFATDENGVPCHLARAEFAILDADDGQIHVSFHHVNYDVAPVLGAIRNSGMPHSRWLIGEWRQADGRLP